MTNRAAAWRHPEQNMGLLGVLLATQVLVGLSQLLAITGGSGSALNLALLGLVFSLGVLLVVLLIVGRRRRVSSGT